MSPVQLLPLLQYLVLFLSLPLSLARIGMGMRYRRFPGMRAGRPGTERSSAQ